MASRITDTRRHLTTVARELFCERGFRGVSMRELSARSGVGLSNIYNYFESKDALFEAVVASFVSAFQSTIIEAYEREYATSVSNYTRTDFQRMISDLYLHLVDNYRIELRLVFCMSAGSKYEHFTQDIMDYSQALSLRFMEEIHNKYPLNARIISPLFMRLCCLWWLEALRLIATHPEITSEEIEVFFEEYVRFVGAGWQALLLNPMDGYGNKVAV